MGSIYTTKVLNMRVKAFYEKDKSMKNGQDKLTDDFLMEKYGYDRNTLLNLN